MSSWHEMVKDLAGSKAAEKEKRIELAAKVLKTRKGKILLSYIYDLVMIYRTENKDQSHEYLKGRESIFLDLTALLAEEGNNAYQQLFLGAYSEINRYMKLGAEQYMNYINHIEGKIK